MATTISPRVAEQRLIGAALRHIRENRDPKPSLRAIGLQIGMSGAAYQKYETGETRIDPDRLTDILRALDADQEELELARAHIMAGDNPVQSGGEFRDRTRQFDINVFGRARAGPIGMEVYDAGEPLRTINMRSLLGPRSDAMEVAGESMSPWVEPGEVVVFDRDRFPKRNQGCVVEMKNGQMLVKQYVKTEDANLFLRELVPETRVFNLPWSEVKGVYAVTVRGG